MIFKQLPTNGDRYHQLRLKFEELKAKAILVQKLTEVQALSVENGQGEGIATPMAQLE